MAEDDSDALAALGLSLPDVSVSQAAAALSLDDILAGTSDPGDTDVPAPSLDDILAQGSDPGDDPLASILAADTATTTAEGSAHAAMTAPVLAWHQPTDMDVLLAGESGEGDGDGGSDSGAAAEAALSIVLQHEAAALPTDKLDDSTPMALSHAKVAEPALEDNPASAASDPTSFFTNLLASSSSRACARAQTAPLDSQRAPPAAGFTNLLDIATGPSPAAASHGTVATVDAPANAAAADVSGTPPAAGFTNLLAKSQAVDSAMSSPDDSSDNALAIADASAASAASAGPQRQFANLLSPDRNEAVPVQAWGRFAAAASDAPTTSTSTNDDGYDADLRTARELERVLQGASDGDNDGDGVGDGVVGGGGSSSNSGAAAGPMRVPAASPSVMRLAERATETTQSSQSLLADILAAGADDEPEQDAIVAAVEASVEQEREAAEQEQVQRVASQRTALELAELEEQTMETTGDLEMQLPPAAAEGDDGDATPALLHVEPLSLVTEQFFRGADHGSPTCLSCRGGWTAIGTAQGCVFVYDADERLAFRLDPSKDVGAHSVAAMDISYDGEWLIAAHVTGALVVWDVTPGNSKVSSVKTIVSDSPHRGTPVTSVAFLADRMRFISADSRGVLALHSLSKFLMVIKHEASLLLREPEPRQICTVAVFVTHAPSGSVSARTPPNSLGLVAIATHTNVTVLTLLPSVSIVAQLPRPANARAGALPSLAWHRTAPSTVALRRSGATGGTGGGSGAGSRIGTGSRVVTGGDVPMAQSLQPTLAVAWDRSVQMFEVQILRAGPAQRSLMDVLSPSSSSALSAGGGSTGSSNGAGSGGAVELAAVNQASAEHEIRACAWLDLPSSGFLLAMSRDHIHMFSTASTNELARAALHLPASAVFHQRLFHESPEHTEMSFASSLGVRGTTAVVLSYQNLVSCRLLQWQERITRLLGRAAWLPALALTLHFYEGTGGAPVGLPASLNAAQDVTSRKLVQVLNGYVATELANASASQQASSEFYQRIAGVCVYYCERVGRTDVLFDEIYPQIEAAGHAHDMLDVLEPYILNDRLRRLNPAIMQALVDRYAQQNKLKRIERCITHIDIMSLDLNQVVTLCRQHQLYTALIDIYSRGLDDYLTPVDELLRAMTKPDAGQDHRRRLGYKLLLYVKYCFAGRAFPRGRIAPQRVLTLRGELMLHVFGRDRRRDAPAVPPAAHLLALDPEAALGVLAAAMEELPRGASRPGLPSAQSVYDALIELLVELMDASEATMALVLPVTPAKRLVIERMLNVFIAQCATADKADVHPDMVASAATYLLTSTDAPSFEQRERLVTRMLRNGVQLTLDESRLLHWAEAAGMWHVAEIIYLRHHDYTKVLACFLRDPLRRDVIFDYVRSLLTEDSSRERHSVVAAAVLHHLPDLLEVDPAACAALIVQHFAQEHEAVLQQLHAMPELQFRYLDGILRDSGDDGGGSSDTVDGTTAQHAQQPGAAGESRLASELARNGMAISRDMRAQYISLMIRFAPTRVRAYLETTDDYEIPVILAQCQEHGVRDACVLLLERMGDISGALDLMLHELNERLRSLKQALVRSPPAALSAAASAGTPGKPASRRGSALDEDSQLAEDDDFDVGELPVDAWAAVQAALCRSTELVTAHRSASPEEAAVLWFHLLDHFLHPLRELSSKQASLPPQARVMIRALKMLLHQTLQKMMGRVPMPAILRHLMASNTGGNSSLNVQGFIRGMLRTYNYEENLLNMAERLIEQDVYKSTLTLRNRLASAIPMTQTSPVCRVCTRSLLTADSPAARADAIVVFQCGHGIHRSCASTSDATASSKLHCPACEAEDAEPSAGAPPSPLQPQPQQPAQPQGPRTQPHSKLDRLVAVKRASQRHRPRYGRLTLAPGSIMPS